MKLTSRLLFFAGLAVIPAGGWQTAKRVEFTSQPVVWPNAAIEGGKLRVSVSSQGPEAPRISIVVKTTNENYSRLNCVAIQRGARTAGAYEIEAMAPVADCSKPAIGKLSLGAPQEPKTAHAIYIELSRDMQFELKWNEQSVFSGKIEASFGWREGMMVTVPFPNGGAALTLARGAQLASQGPQLTERHGVFFANGPALKQNILRASRFEGNLAIAGAAEAPIVPVRVEIGAEGQVRLKSVGPRLSPLQFSIEEYLREIVFKPFLDHGKTVAVTAHLHFLVAADGQVSGPIELFGMSEKPKSSAGGTSCCAK